MATIKSIEEKAKRYDEAVEKLRSLHDNYDTVSTLIGIKEELENIFPELKENEDERIIERIKKAVESYWSDEPLDEILVWLEKQGEQKTEVKYVYTKFQIGDTIVEIKPNGYCQPVRVKYIGDGAYSCESDDGKRSLSFPIINQDDYELVEQRSAWNEEDEKITNDIKESLLAYKIIVMDNDMELANYIEKEINWFKSLKERYTWKPTMEQLTVLSKAIELRPLCESDGTILMSLYYDLKKLREE